jgi:hypothetical protein
MICRSKARDGWCANGPQTPGNHGEIGGFFVGDSQVTPWKNMENHRKPWKSIGYPLVNIQTAIENGHKKRWFSRLAKKNGDVPSFFVCLPEGMVDFMENPFINGWFRGTPISGNLHIYINIYTYLYIYIIIYIYGYLICLRTGSTDLETNAGTT